MNNQRIISKDIAADLGLSPATVSLALNNRPGVNLETKKRIIAHIQKMKQQGTVLHGEMVALLCYLRQETPDWMLNQTLVDYSYMEMSRMCQIEQLELKLQYVYSYEELCQAFKDLQKKTIGMVVCAEEMRPEWSELLDDCSIPAVALDIALLGDNWDTVNFHNYKAIQQGVSLLIDHGHRNIVYIRNQKDIYNFHTRRRAYVNAMTDHQLPVVMTTIDGTLDVACADIVAYINGLDVLPDAIFCENYFVSIALSMAVQKLGLNIPEDFSIIGIDEVPSTVFMPYQMDYFSVPHTYRMTCIVKLLFNRLLHPEQAREAQETLVALTYVKGNSIGQRDPKRP